VAVTEKWGKKKQKNHQNREQELQPAYFLTGRVLTR